MSNGRASGGWGVTHRDFSTPTFIDLFCGIGGMRLAFERAGCRCILSSDWDAHARQTYVANFSENPLGDIRGIDSDEIPDHDILVAGFPCQPFSISGVSKKKSLGRAHGFEDRTQGTLFFEVARILRDKQPESFVLENVKNLISHDRGRTFRTVLQTLEEDLNYQVEYRVLDASAVVPQHRERIFIIGFKHPRAFKWPVMRCSKLKVVDILEPDAHARYHLSDTLGVSTKLRKQASRRRQRFWLRISETRWYRADT